MAEHGWQQGEPVWSWTNPPGGGWWSAGVIKAAESEWAVRVIDCDSCDPAGCSVLYEHLRCRDPALDGADRPTAESEARRG